MSNAADHALRLVITNPVQNWHAMGLLSVESLLCLATEFQCIFFALGLCHETHCESVPSQGRLCRLCRVCRLRHSRSPQSQVLCTEFQFSLFLNNERSRFKNPLHETSFVASEPNSPIKKCSRSSSTPYTPRGLLRVPAAPADRQSSPARVSPFI